MYSWKVRFRLYHMPQVQSEGLLLMWRQILDDQKREHLCIAVYFINLLQHCKHGSLLLSMNELLVKISKDVILLLNFMLEIKYFEGQLPFFRLQ
jgi:hypothetical protein